jgi:hypothetical protein
MTPSSSIGNVGVYSIIETVEKQLELMGIKVEAISSGKYKLLGASFKKMTEEERAILQEDVNKQHEKFKNTVRLKRQVDDKYMEGLAYEGEDALKGNLVDMVVDQFEDFLTTQDMKAIKIDSMKIQGEQTNKEMSLAKDVVPGVPVDSQETPIKTEEPEKIEEEAEEMEECPHCAGKGKIGKCKEKIEGAESEEDKKMESETEKVEESIKEEPAKDEPVKEEKKNKKAEMPDVSEWNSHFGIKKSSNLFYNAALAAVKEAINPKN